MFTACHISTFFPPQNTMKWLLLLLVHRVPCAKLSSWESTEEVVWSLALRAHLLLAMSPGCRSVPGMQACSISTCWASEFQAALVHLRTKQYLCCKAQGTLLNVMWQPGWKRGLERMAESLCYPPETVTTLLPPIPTNYNTDKVLGGGGWGTDSPSLFF